MAFVAFSCKGRGVYPSSNTRRMVETVAHLADHVFPRLPVRQWVLSVSKRLCYCTQRDGTVLGMVLRILAAPKLRFLAGHCVKPAYALPERPAHNLWPVLIAGIYAVFPLLCPLCGGQMRIIAIITQRADIRHILDHIGVESEPPKIAPARGPPLWGDTGDAQMDGGVQIEPDWDLAAQPAPEYEVDQRVN
jgi:hypothetical protein